MITNTISAICEKLNTIANNSFGWVLTSLSLVASYLGDSLVAFTAIGVAIILDAIWGTIVSVKQGKFILSHLMRETMNKFLIYSTTLAMVLFIERSINQDWQIATRIVCAIAASCELWSICANILIIKPNFPFIKLFRRYLIGEISRKIGVSKSELENDIGIKNVE